MTPGSKGAFVQKIQTALLVLDKVSVAASELKTETYGPSTADAIRRYKAARNIINFSYQKTADDIVGKMTIQRMDQEMCEAERRHHHVPPIMPTFT